MKLLWTRFISFRVLFVSIQIREQAERMARLVGMAVPPCMGGMSGGLVGGMDGMVGGMDGGMVGGMVGGMLGVWAAV